MYRLTLCLALLFSTLASGQKITAKFDPGCLHIEWHCVKNNSADIPGFRAALSFTNTASTTMPSGGWTIYFNLRYHGYALASQTSGFVIQHVNGELFSIRPDVGFRGLKTAAACVLEYSGTGRIANYQDVPSGFFWVWESTPEVAIDLHEPTVNKTDHLLPSYDTFATFSENQTTTDIRMEDICPIVPTPARIRLDDGAFTLDANSIITADAAFMPEARYLSREWQHASLSKPRVQTGAAKRGGIILKKTDLPVQSYRLAVTKDNIIIEAGSGAGIFYGMQSLKMLFPVDSWNEDRSQENARSTRIKIPFCEIEDAPRFPFRAFMLDVARNFSSKEEILRVLEVMSLYKLNVFHFHFNDDEGWRLAIRDLPELTETGANRGYPFSQDQRLQPSYGSGASGKNQAGSGFYSRADYVEIVRYAAERHITVVPEIESPGHARAAVSAMNARYEKYLKNGDRVEAERYLLRDLKDTSRYLSNQGFTDNVMNVGLPSTIRFVGKVMDEIKSMHAEAGAPLTLIHMAGDEVPQGSWQGSPACRRLMTNDTSVRDVNDIWQFYFNEIKTLVRNKGLSLYGWQELVMGTQRSGQNAQTFRDDFLQDDVLVDAWWNQEGSEDIPYKLANNGFRTVLSCVDYFYFDLAHADSFDEPGDGWVGFLDTKKIFSFIPFDYYSNDSKDIRGRSRNPDFFKDKATLTAAGKKNIFGIQGALWGENLVAPDLLEYQLLPKLLAMAEKAWAPEKDWERATDTEARKKLFVTSWARFANCLGKHELPRLDFYNGGYAYRIPVPGVSVTNNFVAANVDLPGFKIRYSNDGSDPLQTSPEIGHGIPATGHPRLRAFDTRGRGGKIVDVRPLLARGDNDEQDITQVIESETEAFVARDSSRLAGFYSRDSITQTVWNNPDGTFGAFRGVDAIRKNFGHAFRLNPAPQKMPNIERAGWRFSRLSADWVWVDFTQRMALVDGTLYSSHETRLMKRETSGWKIAVLHAFSDHGH